MDMQSNKIWIIEQLLKIQDEVLLSRLKSFIQYITRANAAIEPMSLDEFYSIIENSEKDIAEGHLIEHAELRKEINTWRKS